MQSASMGDTQPRQTKSEVNGVQEQQHRQQETRLKQGRKNRITCFRCGKEDHMAKEGKCPPHEKRRGTRGRCYCWGKESRFGRDDVCPARKAKCRHCHNIGHYDSVCKTKMSGQGQKKDRSQVNAVESDDEYVFTVSLNTPAIDDASIDVKIEG